MDFGANWLVTITQSRQRLIVAGLAVVIAVSLGWSINWLLKPTPSIIDYAAMHGEMSPRYRPITRETQHEMWKKAEYLILAETKKNPSEEDAPIDYKAYAKTLEEHLLRLIVDHDANLSEKQKRSLAKAAAEQMVALSYSDREDYRRFVDENPGRRWADERDTQLWKMLSMSYEPQLGGQPWTDYSVGKVLGTIWEGRMENGWCRLRAFGTDEMGAALVAYTARNMNELFTKPEALMDDDTYYRLMRGASVGTHQITYPKTELARIVRNRAGAQCAYLTMVVQTHTFNHGLVQSVWFYDEESDTWQPYTLWQMGGDNFPAFL